MNPSIEVFTSATHIPLQKWESVITSNNAHLSIHHLKAIEESGINNIKPHYLTGSYNGTTDFISYFFIMDFDFSTINSNILPENLDTIRRWHPNIFNMKMLECGLLEGLGNTIFVNNGNNLKNIPSILNEIESIAKRDNVDFILVRDVSLEQYEAYKSIMIREGYQPLMGYPNSYMISNWDTFDQYLNTLKSNTRKNARKHIEKLNVDEITVEILQQCTTQETEQMEKLWLQVYDKVDDYKHEYLTAKYFKQIHENLPDSSHTIAIKKEDQIIAFAQCHFNKEEYFLAHAGIDYSLNTQYDLYFNLFYLGIKEAIKRNINKINFGITTYNFKMLIGCELEPYIYFIKHIKNKNLTTALAHLLEASISFPKNEHRPFMNQNISDRIDLTKIQERLQKDCTIKSNDLFNKAYHYERARKLELTDLYNYFPVFESPQRAVMQNLGQSVVMLGSNSYLGLGSHEAMIETAKIAIDIYGTGCSGSPIMNGTMDVHADLCRALAQWLGKEDVILFSTGYQTNLGVISTIVGRHEVIVTDSLNHASIIDGSLFSRGQIIKYKHGDLRDLERVLKENSERPMLLIVDAVFSMEGTIIDMPGIVKLGKKYGARIMVDEAHGLGVLGENGRGAVEYFGLIDEVDIIMGTFSKSFASIGGFIATEAKVAHYLKHVSRSHLFSASLPPAVIATVRKALDIIKNEPERRLKLMNNARFMAKHLGELGYDAEFHGTAIVPIYCRNELLTFAFFRKLYQEGVYVNPVISPAVPKGNELLRTSYMATHDEEDLMRALDVFKRLRTPHFPLH